MYTAAINKRWQAIDLTTFSPERADTLKSFAALVDIGSLGCPSVLVIDAFSSDNEHLVAEIRASSSSHRSRFEQDQAEIARLKEERIKLLEEQRVRDQRISAYVIELEQARRTIKSTQETAVTDLNRLKSDCFEMKRENQALQEQVKHLRAEKKQLEYSRLQMRAQMQARTPPPAESAATKRLAPVDGDGVRIRPATASE